MQWALQTAEYQQRSFIDRKNNGKISNRSNDLSNGARKIYPSRPYFSPLVHWRHHPRRLCNAARSKAHGPAGRTAESGTSQVAHCLELRWGKAKDESQCPRVRCFQDVFGKEITSVLYMNKYIRLLGGRKMQMKSMAECRAASNLFPATWPISTTYSESGSSLTFFQDLRSPVTPKTQQKKPSTIISDDDYELL